MEIIVLGINHRTAPVEIREKFSFVPKRICEANQLLKQSASLDENLILSTCNRTEIYAIASRNNDSIKSIENFLSKYHNIDTQAYKNRFYIYRNKDAVEHLFKVASGLDSMVIGEVEILAQVKKAYEAARQSLTTGKVLNRLFEKAFNTAKKIRSKTFISRGAISVSSVAVRLAKKILGNLGKKKALVIGAGKVGEQLILYLKKEGLESILVTNRTLEKAKSLAEAFGASVLLFEDFRAALAQVDIVITSTGAPHYIIHKDELLTLMQKRAKRPLFIIDLAVPRDVEPGLNPMDSVYLYDIDDLQKTVDETYIFRKSEVEECFKFVASSSQMFVSWLVSEGLCQQKRESGLLALAEAS